MSIRRGRLLFGGLLLALFLYAAWEALTFPRLARYLPLYISVAGSAITAAYLGAEMLRTRRRRAPEKPSAPPSAAGVAAADNPLKAALASSTTVDLETSPPWGRAGYFFLWTVGFALAIWVLDVRATAPLFVASFLYVEADVRRPRALLLAAAGALIGLIAIGTYMQLRWPESLIQLPW